MNFSFAYVRVMPSGSAGNGDARFALPLWQILLEKDRELFNKLCFFGRISIGALLREAFPETEIESKVESRTERLTEREIRKLMETDSYGRYLSYSRRVVAHW